MKYILTCLICALTSLKGYSQLGDSKLQIIINAVENDFKIDESITKDGDTCLIWFDIRAGAFFTAHLVNNICELMVIVPVDQIHLNEALIALDNSNKYIKLSNTEWIAYSAGRNIKARLVYSKELPTEIGYSLYIGYVK